jgi:hypothetical protein
MIKLIPLSIPLRDALFLAQAQAAVVSIATLATAVGHALGAVVIFSYAYAVIMIIMACIQERGDGGWKYALARAIGMMGATLFANLFLNIFFPGEQVPISFA